MPFLDLLFPRKCLECDEPGQYLCKSCLSKVRPSPLLIPSKELGKLKKVQSIWKYEGVVRKAVLRLKYNFAYDIAGELTDLISKKMVFNKAGNILIIPIPLHRQRKNWRGFNQSEILGKRIAEGLEVGFEQNLLTRKLASKQQVGLSQKERLQNISGKYAVNKELTRNHKGKTIVIFDDVWTTGATMREAAKVLRKAGFKEIYGLTICR